MGVSMSLLLGRRSLSFHGFQEMASLLPDLSLGNDVEVKKTMGSEIFYKK